MHAAATSSPSRFATWRALENQMDRWASLGALAVGLSGLLLAMLL